MFAPLANGKIIEGRTAQCPLHRARFHIRTAEVVDGRAAPGQPGCRNFVRGEKARKTCKASVEDGARRRVQLG